VKHTNELVDPETDLVEKGWRLIIIIRLGGSFGFLLEGFLDVESLGSELLGLSSIVSDKDVVDWSLDLPCKYKSWLTEDVLSHGPKLNSNTGNLGEIGWRAVFEEGRVGDLSRRPFSLVVWVDDFRYGPFTLVFWVSDLGGGPWSTSSTFLTFRVGYHRWDPISILLVLPVSTLHW
jgi:hypothetical protein